MLQERADNPTERVVSIDGRDFACRIDAEGLYRFQIEGRDYAFRQWTWGEKNRVVDAATVGDSTSAGLRLDLARFNELMLARCLVEATGLESITVEALRALHPVLGDTLLSLAYWVNEVHDEEKKK